MRFRVAPSPHPFPLPDQPADFSGLRYTAGTGTFDINAFVSHNHIVGLLAILDGNVVLERYAQGNTPDTRWYSFSVAKSVVSMLWWLRPEHAFAAVGIYGQAIYINPSCRLIVVTHSVWPRATDPELSAHREAFFGEMARWAAARDGGSCGV